MKDATTLDTPPSSTFTEFNVRLEKGKPHFIRLQDGVVRDLERQLVRSGEQSGVLFGSIEGTDTCTISVEGFEAALKVDERVRGNGVRKIVGMYRSHSRPDFTLEPADRTLFQRCFPKEGRLLLLVKPPKTGAGIAMFLLGENGQLAMDHATVEFPFNLRELGADESPAPPLAVVASPAAVARPSAKSGIGWKIGAGVVAVIASVVGLNGLGVFDGPKPQAQPAVVEKAAPVTEPPTPAVIPEPPKPAPTPAKTVVKAPPLIVAPKVAPRMVTPAPKVVETPRPQPTLVAENPVQAPPPPVAQPRTLVPTPSAPTVSAPAAPVVAPVQQTPRVTEPVIPVTPPRALRQFAPTVSEKVRRSITGEVVVKVKVNVDPSGKVIAAESLATGNSVAEALAGAAISAVKKWQFEPARRGEQKVAGELVLSFTFRK